MPDIIFATGAMLFVIALIPALLSEQKPPVTTCILTGAILTVFTVTYISIGFYIAAVTCCVNAFQWHALWVQQLAH